MFIIAALLLSLSCLAKVKETIQISPCLTSLQFQAHGSNVHLLVFETNEYVARANTMLQENLPEGLDVIIVGQGHAFDGFGTKYAVTIPVLEDLDPEAIAILSDGRDVLLNRIAFDNSSSIVDEFRTRLADISGGRSVVVSAEALCCVGALTHAAPGDYFTKDGQRNQRACFSGKGSCLWNGDDKRVPWEQFMQDVAKSKNADRYQEIYLNAGLMAGKAADLLRVLKKADISNDEDDQAVLTDYMYNFPEDLVLDYSQSLFGSNRHHTCMFEMRDNHRFVHIETNISPFLIHSPGNGVNCHQAMADIMKENLPVTVPALDSKSPAQAARVLQSWNAEKGDNYDLEYGLVVSSFGGKKKWCLGGDKKGRNGGEVRLTTCKNKPDRLWRMDKDGKLHSSVDDTKCMVVGDGSELSSGEDMRMEPCDLDTNLNMFKLKKKDGLLKIEASKSFCVTFRGKKAAKKAAIRAKKCMDRPDFQWAFEPL